MTTKIIKKDRRAIKNEILIVAKPCSGNAKSKSKNRWKEIVKTEARSQYKTKISKGDIGVILNYFYNEKNEIDTDNLSKPIQDALKGIVYEDDKQIKDSQVLKFNYNGSFNLHNPSTMLIKAIAEKKDCVLIQISAK